LRAQSSQQLRRQQLEKLKDERRNILARATRKADELISATETRMKTLRKRQAGPVSPQQAVADREQLAQARAELQPFKPGQARSRAIPENIAVGELVKIVALGCDGKVIKVSGKNIELEVAGKRMRQPLRSLEQYQPRRFAGAPAAAQGSRVTRKLVERQASTQLKLVGVRVEEALALLSRFIDDALLAHLSQVEVIHGSGTGRLRRAVREYLASEHGVTAFYAAPADQGGENITIVELNGR